MSKEIDEATCCMKTACCCTGKCCKIPDELAIGLAIFGEILSSVDLVTDWVLMVAFFNDPIKDAYTWGLLAILIVSSLFYLWELYIFILFVKIRAHCYDKEELDETQNTISYNKDSAVILQVSNTGDNEVTGEDAKKKKISMYREIASYMLLLLEDIPIQMFTVAFAFVLLGNVSNTDRSVH